MNGGASSIELSLPRFKLLFQAPRSRSRKRAAAPLYFREDRRPTGYFNPREGRNSICPRAPLRDGEMAAATVDLAEKALLDEYARWIHWDVTEPLLDIAGALVKRLNLRSLHALQLASALYFGEYLLPTDHLLFVASDQRLIEAAAEGLAIWNPEISPIPPHLL